MWMSETAGREGLVNELKSKGEREEWAQEDSEDCHSKFYFTRTVIVCLKQKLKL